MLTSARSVRVGVQRLADQFVGHIRPIELGGVDVIDAEFDGPPEHRSASARSRGGPEHAGTGQLNGAKAYVVDVIDQVRDGKFSGRAVVRVADGF